MPNRAEEIGSKAMGGVKAVKATIEGLSGVFKELAKEHGELSALMLRVQASSDPDVRRDLFPKIRKELLSHEKGELLEVYPKFREFEQLRKIAEEHEQEASELEQLVEKLNAMAFDDDAWGSRYNELVDKVQHHVSQEENSYFPTANEVFGNVETEEIEPRFMHTKSEVMAQLG